MIIDTLKKSWKSAKPNRICVRTCGQKNQNSNFSAQWQRVVELS